MKISLFLSLGLIIALQLGCQSTPPKIENESRDYILKDLDWSEAPVFGNAAFVSFSSQDQVSEDLKRESSLVVNQLQEGLKQLGFTISPKRVDVQLWVDIEMRAIHDSGADESVVMTYDNKNIYSKVRSDIEGKTYELNYRGSSQEYGKRPKTVFYGYVKAGTQKRLSEVLRDQAPIWVKEFSQLKIEVPEKKMKGPPGCLPRFGFEVRVSRNSQGTVFTISEVLKSSAAEKAGLKVGDQIVGIDSVDYHSFSTKDESEKIYENQTEVPVKVLRAGKEVRTKIKSKISCE